jgi:hypothetical protein
MRGDDPPPPALVKAPVVAAPAPTDFSRPVARRVLAAASASAYVDGGVPLADPVVEAAFAKTLPRFLVVNDAIVRGAKDPEGERERLLASLRAPELLAALGPAATARWNDLLDGIAEVSRLKPGSEKFQNAAMRLADAAGLLDDELARRGLGYQLDADVRTRSDSAMTALHAYRVGRCCWWRRVRRGARARGPAAGHAEHGPRPPRHAGRVPARSAGPASQAGGARGDPDPAGHWVRKTLKLGDEAWNGTEDGRAVAALAGDVVRDTMSGPLGADLVRARTVGALLIERESTVDEWRRSLAGRVRIPRIETALIPEIYFAQLRGALDDSLLTRAGKIDVRLAEMDVVGVVARVTDVLMGSIARHEAQHGLDDDRDVELPMPVAIAAMAGSTGRRAESGRNELSAYLSEIASDDELARLDVVLLSRFAFDSGAWGYAEGDVAAVLLVEMARAVGVDVGDAPLIVGGEYDRARLSKAFIAVVSKPTAEVQVAARKAYEALFGEKLNVLR